MTEPYFTDDCANAGESGASSEFKCPWTAWQAAELRQRTIVSDDAPEATFRSKWP